jgi:hypothetical protein
VSGRFANSAFAALLALFAFLHLHRLGEISPTWDEGGDQSIVDCLQKTRDPFACTADISQTRLPFYIHALVGPAYGPERPHYLVSFFFNLATLSMLYAFARRRFGLAIATLTAALYVTSPQLLASGRMLLTHSNIIFACFTTGAILCILEFCDGPAPHPPSIRSAVGRSSLRWLVACAVFSGLAAASHPLGVFNGLVILAVYLAGRRYAWRDLVYFPVAATTFFATSVIYIKPANFRALVDACLHGGEYTFWSYFGTGSPHAPWWFPLVVCIVKIGPWWLVLAAVCVGQTLLSVQAGREGGQTRVVGQTGVSVLQVAFVIAFFVNLLLKGAVFHYEAPHHQVQFYPVLYLVIATLLVRAWRPAIAVAVAAAFAIQTWDVVRFFPNYLFYGSQYGERFIGEFYGPAVMHAQDKDPINHAIDRIFEREPNARILSADNNMVERADPRIVPFTKREPNVVYDYAIVDRLYATHFQFPERDAYNRYIAAGYVPYYTYYFPPHLWMYRVMRHR